MTGDTTDAAAINADESKTHTDGGQRVRAGGDLPRGVSKLSVLHQCPENHKRILQTAEQGWGLPLKDTGQTPPFLPKWQPVTSVGYF